MLVSTTRFGILSVEPEDLLFFRDGLIGFEDCRHWVLLGDPGNPVVAWLQSMDRPETALAVVSPRRFAPGYRVLVSRHELESLGLDPSDRAYVLCTVAVHEDRRTLNLQAPLLLNLDRGTARQVITRDLQPVQWTVPSPSLAWRKSA